MESLKRLLPNRILERVNTDTICEIRMRTAKPLTLCDGENVRAVDDVIVGAADIAFVMGVASGYSQYSVTENIVNGFVHFEGGVRIGVCGEGVMRGDCLTAQKFISSLVIRVPREAKGCADKIIEKIYNRGDVKNTLIIAPTAGGKTAVLREIARLLSGRRKNVVIVDERFELAASAKGVCGFDVGQNTDVISGVPKIIAYENAVRALNPDVIVTDEVYRENEFEVLKNAVRSGVKVLASVHGKNAQSVSEGAFADYLKMFDLKIVLSKARRAGEIAEVAE